MASATIGTPIGKSLNIIRTLMGHHVSEGLSGGRAAGAEIAAAITRASEGAAAAWRRAGGIRPIETREGVEEEDEPSESPSFHGNGAR